MTITLTIYAEFSPLNQFGCGIKLNYAVLGTDCYLLDGGQLSLVAYNSQTDSLNPAVIAAIELDR
ncbi:MAG: hypothetical protein AAGK10_14310 [Cyanobacteria bacterium J06555_3]